MKNSERFLRFATTICGLVFVLTIQAQVSGVVFRDLNGDGVRNNSASFSEPFVSGVTVKAFDSAGMQVGSTTTNSSGAYNFIGLTLPLRIEFSDIPSGDFSGPYGSGSGTSVQFYSAPTSSANFGINYPANYCQNNPPVFTSCFIGGAQTGTQSVLVSFPYNSTGTPSYNTNAVANQVGSVWGLAYNKNSNRVYAAAFIKRHSGLGPGGIGAIYEIDPSGMSSPALWLDVETLSGVDAGSIGSNAARGLGNSNISNTDPTAFDKVGKEGLGDIELSDDGQTLYVMNLFERSVLVIDVSTKTLLENIAIDDPGCGANGTWRPFGIGYHKGALYVGIICSGESSGTIGDFFVQRRDGATWTTVLTGPLNYPKGWVHALYASPPTVCSSFESWTSDFSGIYEAGFSVAGPRWCRPQPILSDIEFDIDGTMILGFIDRAGHQLGYQQNNLAGNQVGNGYVGGDILRAYNNNGTYVLENAGTTLEGGGCGPNGQGPGGGEFYCGELYEDIHQETAIGGLALRKGRGQVLTSAMDPGANVFSGGIIRLSNTSGLKDGFYELFVFTTGDPTTFGKAAGIGDVELLCNPAPIEIGNRVWEDQNNNGVQDAGEPGISGVAVTLWKDDGMGNFTQVASATTDANGHYYFSSAAGTSTASAVYGVANLLPNMSYELRFPAAVGGFNRTIPNNGGMDANADARDSDANPAGVVPFMTGGPGQNRHNYDVGYGCGAPVCRTTGAVKN